ncbi:protein kinase [Achlya hypogyna]|uniref:Protein kinase n=1 Tax=Achlya hypogyna TaxID=1202772 RepID=A0A1V9YL49_ACHHY|nr:protein kinase [Achlya hypogyna]
MWSGRRLQGVLVLESASTSAGGLSTTTLALLIAGGVVVFGLLIGVVCHLQAKAKKRDKLLRREAQRIQETRAMMECNYEMQSDAEPHVQLANDVRFDPTFAHTRIPHHELFNLRLVAKGPGTVVFRAIFNSMEIAVKQLLPSQCSCLLTVTDFMREIRLSSTLEHPNIVRFIGLAWTEGPSLSDLSLLTEFMPHGDLATFLAFERKTPIADRRLLASWEAHNPWVSSLLGAQKSLERTTSGATGSFKVTKHKRQRIKHEMTGLGTSKTTLAADVADALSYLHSFQPTIIHRDLKSKNVLLSATWSAQLNDFGYSRVTSQDELMTMNVGTIAWIAPEIITGGRYTESADIYSFGVLMSELDTLEVPYIEHTREYIQSNHQELENHLHHPRVKAKAKVLSNAFIAMLVGEGKLTPSFTSHIPVGLLELAQQCLSFNPAERPSAIELSYRLRSTINTMTDSTRTCGQNPGGMQFVIANDTKLAGGMGICSNAPLAPSSNASADSGSGSTVYVIVGIAVAVLFILAAVIYKLKLKNDVAKHKFDYINETDAGGMPALDNFTNPEGVRVANDIRFDEELSQFRIPQQEIQNISLLVKGGYGVVFHATFGKDDVAMKQLLPSKAKDHNAIQEFMNEIRLCARLEHPKIVKFIGISWSTLHDLAVLSEFMSRGDVSTLLKKDAKKSESHRLLHWESGMTRDCATTKGTIAADIADALVYLHSFQPTIIHRDLKSKNVLLADDWTAKLSDFGISRVTSLEESMTSNIGTVAWIAPEVLTGGRYTEKADIYSFGVLLSELDTCEVPYTSMTGKSKDAQFSNARIAMMVSEGTLRPAFSDRIPEAIHALAQECLAFDPSERPAAMTLSYKIHTISMPTPLPTTMLRALLVFATLGLAAGQDTAACTASQNESLVVPYQALEAPCLAALNLTSNPTAIIADPAGFCKQSACVALASSANALLNTCLPTPSAVPGKLCSSGCQSSIPRWKDLRAQCITVTASTLGYCYTCKKYLASVSDVIAACQIQDSASAIRNDETVLNMVKFCDASMGASTAAPSSSDGSSNTTYVVIGCIAGVVVLGAVIFYCCRQKKPRGDVYSSGQSYQNGGSNRHLNSDNSGTLNSAHHMNTRVANDIRFDTELSQFRIPQQEIQNISLLVKGGYGVVFHATFGKTDVAMKQLLPSKAKDHSAIQDFMNEIRLCARLEHPKIVNSMSNGDVTNLIRKERKRPEANRLLHWYPQGDFPATKTSISADVADALVYLHSFQPTVIHRDLKSKNVLLSESWEAKLSDFGISRVTSLEESMTSNIGTIAWIAPEVLTGGRYTEKADIYSFGVLMAELDTLAVPYAELLGKSAENGFSNARLAMMVSEGELQPSFTETMPEELLALARECLSFHDAHRPSAIQLSYKLHQILKKASHY